MRDTHCRNAQEGEWASPLRVSVRSVPDEAGYVYISLTFREIGKRSERRGRMDRRRVRIEKSKRYSESTQKPGTPPTPTPRNWMPNCENQLFSALNIGEICAVWRPVASFPADTTGLSSYRRLKSETISRREFRVGGAPPRSSRFMAPRARTPTPPAGALVA